MRQKIKGKKGITLIVLIITVILMLILAGVAVSAITADGMPFGKVKDIAGKYNNTVEERQNAIDKIIGEMNNDYIGGGSTGNGNTGSGDDDKPGGDNTDKGTIGEITDKNVTINGETGSKENPIIPKGFKPINEGEAVWGSEDGWNKGLVIEDVDGNQYVWVPVNVTISEAIQTKLDTGVALTVSEIQSTWERKAWDYGRSYTESTRGKLDTSIYKEPYASGYSTEQNEYIEMGTSVLKNGGFYVGRYEGGTETKRTASTDPTSTLLSKANVYPYNFVSWGKEMNDTGEYKEGSKGAVELCREKYSGKEGYGVNSSLIYGVQWDSIMEWIEQERNVSDSTTWGNHINRVYTIAKGTEYYSCDSSSWTTAASDINTTTTEGYILKTGEYAETKTNGTENTEGIVKNIFDLAGNLFEWSMETIKNVYRYLPSYSIWRRWNVRQRRTSGLQKQLHQRRSIRGQR